MRKMATIAASAALVLALSACGGSGSAATDQPAEQAAPEATSEVAAEAAPEAEPEAQAFETEQARVEYCDTQDVGGNAMVNFLLENRTGSTLMVTGENLVLNGEYSISTLGGSAVPIAAGKSGAVSLAFGYSVQTPITEFDKLATLEGDLVLTDDATFDRVGTVHFSVKL